MGGLLTQATTIVERSATPLGLGDSIAGDYSMGSHVDIVITMGSVSEPRWGNGISWAIFPGVAMRCDGNPGLCFITLLG